jgi:hypothetical protein
MAFTDGLYHRLSYQARLTDPLAKRRCRKVDGRDHRRFTLTYRTTTSINTSKMAHAMISVDCMRALSKTFRSPAIEETFIIYFT